MDIESEAFKRAYVTHRNVVTTAMKRTSRTNECDRREEDKVLKEDLEKNVTLCLHNRLCRIRESSVDPLTCCKQRVEEQKCWKTVSNIVRLATDVLQDTGAESAESMSQEGGRDGSVTKKPNEEMQKGERLEEFRSFRAFQRQKLKQRNEQRSN